jgi:hypothetical protein
MDQTSVLLFRMQSECTEDITVRRANLEGYSHFKLHIQLGLRSRSSIILMSSEIHRIDEVARSFERNLRHLSGRPTPSSMGLIPNSDDNAGIRWATKITESILQTGRTLVDYYFTLSRNLPDTMRPMVGIDHASTSEITSIETHGIAPSTSVRASTSIPAMPRQLGSASRSAPLMVSVCCAHDRCH